MPNSNSKTHPTPTMNRNRNEGQRELFSGSLRQAEGAENDRTFELSFSSEEPYTRWFGPEILDHSDGCVDMSRLTEIGVVLFNHDRDQVIGKIKSARIEGNRGLATVEFDDDPESERIAAKVRSGTLKGVDKGKKSLDGRFTGPCSIAKRWMPYEVSIVSVPADATVGVGRELENEPEPTAPQTQTGRNRIREFENIITRNKNLL